MLKGFELRRFKGWNEISIEDFNLKECSAFDISSDDFTSRVRYSARIKLTNHLSKSKLEDNNNKRVLL